MDDSERFRGSLVGLACGDALGVTNQFQRPGSFTPISELSGGGVFGLLRGQWTDDAALALCLATSLIESNGFDARDQLSRYVRWWRNGYMSCVGRCFDIGGTTSAALSLFLKTGQPYCGSNRPYTAGNSSVVRLAPVVLCYCRKPDLALEMAVNSSRTTHALRLNIDACRLFSGLLLGALAGRTKSEILDAKFEPVPGVFSTLPLCAEIEEIRQGSYERKQPPEIRAKGYVVESLEAALWAFSRGNSFRDGALAAVNLGGDATSVGALFGQLAGAFYGLSDIPVGWRQALAEYGLCERTADALLALCERV